MSSITADLRMLHASGIGTYIRNLVPRVIEARADVRFTLLGDPAELGRLPWTRRSNVGVVPCTSAIYSLREQVEVPRKIPRETELLWSPHYNIPVLYRGKLLVTVHDAFHLARAESLPKKLYARAMFGAVRRKADAILTDSHFTKSELRRLTGEGRQEIRPIHLGVDDGWFDVEKRARPHPRPYLLYVGNVKPHKNVAGLVRAFQHVSRDIPHDLVIVGKKEGFITGDREVAEMARGLGERVEFTGHVSEEDLRQYVVQADALVFPSFYEGFGLPPLEAMACGCPVIVSNAASLPEVCGDAALYCRPEDPADIAEKIRLLTGDPRLRCDLRARGLARARTFTWDTCARETLAVIERLLAT